MSNVVELHEPLDHVVRFYFPPFAQDFAISKSRAESIREMGLNGIVEIQDPNGIYQINLFTCLMVGVFHQDKVPPNPGAQ